MRKRRMLRVEPRASLTAPFKMALAGLSAVFFPSDCRLCHASLVSLSRLPVCPECLESLDPIDVPQCVLCGERLTGAQLLIGNGQCAGCTEYPPEFDRAVSYGEYQGGLRDLIHLLKYHSVLPASKPLGKLLAKAVATLHVTADDSPILVPVPLHSSKRRERKFNQAELIAWAALKHLPKSVAVEGRVMVRQRETRSQVGLDREARIQNMRGAFKVIAPRRVGDRTVIVLDDVMTTGTTVSECARVLKRAGAARVFAATVARTLKAADAPGFSRELEGEEAEATQLVPV
jgi:ComF family protein